MDKKIRLYLLMIILSNIRSLIFPYSILHTSLDTTIFSRFTHCRVDFSYMYTIIGWISSIFLLTLASHKKSLISGFLTNSHIPQTISLNSSVMIFSTVRPCHHNSSPSAPKWIFDGIEGSNVKEIRNFSRISFGVLSEGNQNITFAEFSIV